MDNATQLVCVGVVATAHGVRGALRVKSFTEEPENVAAYGPLHDHTGRELFRLTILSRTGSGHFVVKADGVTTRDAAEALRGVELYVPRSALPATDEDEFYREDLIGMAAVGPDGKQLGEVTGVFDFGAGDVLEVTAPDTASFTVPFRKEQVPEVDVAARRVVVVRIEGI